jgi:isopenicillin N synthase-like dioxygenase
MTEIPVVDIGNRNSSTGRRALAKLFEVVARDRGFLYLANHGISDDLISSAFEAARRFHALPLEEKLALKQNGAHRGYQAPASVTLVSSAKFAPATKPSQRSCLVVRHDINPEDLDPALPLQGPNQWPADPWVRKAATAYRDAVTALGLSMLPVFALAVGENEEFFKPYFDPPTTTLLMAHYPAETAQGADEFGSAPHTDYGFSTFLVQDSVGGLQVQREDNTWIDVTPIPGTFVFNIGDMMARWTNDQFRSTRHRVINKDPTRDRYSLPIFFDPNLKAKISCLSDFVTHEHPAKFEPIRFGDYYALRLNSNYAPAAAGKVPDQVTHTA